AAALEARARTQSPDDRPRADFAHAGSRAADAAASRPHGRHRPHGRLPRRSTRRTRKADHAEALSQPLREDLAPVVALEAGVPLEGCPPADEAALLRVRSTATDVGDGLADHRKLESNLRAGADAGARRTGVSQCRRQILDSLENHRKSLAVLT